MRVFVTGSSGQLALSLLEVAHRRGEEVVAVGRPDLDLGKRTAIETSIAHASPTVVVSAAAYTAVDKAESETELAHAINAEGAGAVAVACNKLGIPIIHISTDYVFDGRKAEPYVESDPTRPVGAYGRSKLEGERRVAAGCRQHVILRTSWLYSPFGHNFVKSMLELAETRPEVGVVDDQFGNPTYAPHLAEAVLTIAARIIVDSRRDRLWGICHAAGIGKTTWHGFAGEIFRCSNSLGGPHARTRAIASAEYVTPAERPANSQLDCTNLKRVFGVVLPSWQAGTRACVARLVKPTGTVADAPTRPGNEK